MVLIAWPSAGAAQALVTSSKPDSVSVTLYREAGLTSRELQEEPGAADRGLVMITEMRTLDVPAGPARIAFRGVADGMLPETAAVTGVEVAEQDYAYDLLTPGALAARSIGESVRLVRTDPATGEITDERAVIRSAPEGVVLDLGGRFEALSCSGMPEKLVFERVPPGFADRPTLSVLTRAAAPGRRTIRLSYLATGLAWSADYVAKLNPDGRTMDLTGWLTLANSGDTTFGQAPTDVVAGTLNREQIKTLEPLLISREDRCWPRPVRWKSRWISPPPPLFSSPPPPPPPLPPPPAPVAETAVEEIVVTGARMARQGELGDYKLYTLPEPTTVAARQVKQVRFLEQRAVPVARIYEARLTHRPTNDQPIPATILLRATNTRVAGLGEPLPAGNVVVMEPGRSGRMFFVGQTESEDMRVGLPVEYDIGTASDIVVEEDLTEQSGAGAERTRLAYEVTMFNAKAAPVTLELRAPALNGSRVIHEDARHTEKDGAPLWSLTLKPGEVRIFRYTLEGGR